MCHFVCRHFKLILHRKVDVLSSDFKAFVVDVGNRWQSIDVEGEFYHGFEKCKFFSYSVYQQILHYFLVLTKS